MEERGQVDPYTVMVCGSREMAPGAENYIRKVLVPSAKERGYRILIGDAIGTDYTVGMACIEQGVPFMVVGIGNLPRFEIDLSHYSQIVRAAYTDRDRFMIDFADQIIGLWNGKSAGTKRAIEYADAIGKKATLYVNFTKWED